MSVTPFSIVLIIIYLRLYFLKNVRKRFQISFVIAMICSIVIYMGYFIQLPGGGNIPHATIAWLACTFYAYGLNKTQIKGICCTSDINKKIRNYLLCLIATIISFYIYRYDKPVVEDSDYESFMQGLSGYALLKDSSFKFGWVYVSLMLCFILKVAYNKLNLQDVLYIGDKFLKYTIVVLVIGYIEFFTENFLHTLFVTNTTVSFFGESGIQQIMFNEDRGWSNIQVFTKEASMFSASLLYSVFVAINMVILNGMQKKYLFYIGAAMLLMVLNTSMSSYVYVFLLLVFIAYLRPFSNSNKGTNPQVAIWVLVFIVLVLTSQSILSSDSYLSTRLNESIMQFSGFKDNSFSYTSEGLRFFGMYECFIVFIDRPLWGVGLGCVSCISGIVTLLSNLGALGLCAYMALMLPSINGIRKIDFIFLMVIVIIAPNIMLNDLNTMFALIIPFATLLTAFSIKFKNRELK